MSANDVRRNPDQNQPARRTIRDIPGCIKYIILLFLLLLLFAEYYAGEFRGFPKVSQLVWLIFFFKLLLIILLLILIWVQRRLNCNITAPVGCTNVEYDAANDRWFIKVVGTASGTVFGNYTLAVERPPGTPYPATIIYPGGGGSGTSMVNNGELGRIVVTNVQPAPMRVILTVNPAGTGSPCVHTSDFDWANRSVYIEKIAAVPAQIMGPHPADPTEVLKLIKTTPNPADPDASVGGSISVEGGADFTGCGREMVEYVLQYRGVDPGNLPWQQDAGVAGDWANINSPLPFGGAANPRTFLWALGTWVNAITHGRLTRVWASGSFVMTLIPWVTALRPYTAEQPWNTASGPMLNGRYTVRLVVKHQPTTPPLDVPTPELYDAATVWIDNREIQGQIWNLGIMDVVGGLGVCDEILMSQFVTPNPIGPPPPAGPFSKVNATINGRAWDPVILDSYLLPGPTADQPNDNFNQYVLDFKKNGAVDFLWPITTRSTRAPNILQDAALPALPANLAQLALPVGWNIVAALDAGPPQPSPAPDPKIYRGERCAYIIRLRVWDKTTVGDGGSTHYIEHEFPFCIMNDLPNSLVPDAVTTLWPMP